MCKNGENGNGNGRLRGKQVLFVEAYLECFNATEAARRAGYEGNDNTLGSVGWENLQKPAIAKRISVRLQEAAMSADEVLSRLAEIARGEHGQYIGIGGKVDLAMMIFDNKTHLIKSIKDTRHGQSITFCDMQGALALIAKHHGLLVERHEVSGAGGGPLEFFYTNDWRNAEQED